MACDISLGRLEPCKSVGGLKAVYFINYDNSYYESKSINLDEEVEDLGSAFNLYKYELRGANNFDEANEVSKENGTSFWTATGTLVFKAQDASTRKQMKLLSYGRPIVVTEGYDGQYKIYGLENGCDVAVNTASGAGMGDLNGYNITITAQEKEPAFFVDWTIFASAGKGTVIEGV
jgi:hypothetical protein